MPRTGDERRRSRRGQRGSLSPCIGHGEPTVEEVRIYVNIVRGRRKTANTAINYVYAYKTKARAFESIKDASKVREEGREREREGQGVTFMHRVLFDGPIISRFASYILALKSGKIEGDTATTI